MQSRKQQGAGRSVCYVPKQASELEMQYLVERRGRLLWVGARRNVPSKLVLDGWGLGQGTNHQSAWLTSLGLGFIFS